MIKALQSTGKKRGLGAWIVISPTIVKYAIKLSNQQLGTEFEVSDDLLNILFATGSAI